MKPRNTSVHQGPKWYTTLLAIVFTCATLPVWAQTGDGAGSDTACDKTANAILKRISIEGKAAKYFLGNGFLAYMTPFDSTARLAKIYLLNYGEERTCTGTLTRFSLQVVDGDGKTGTLNTKTPREVITEHMLSRCDAVSVRMEKIDVANFTMEDFKYVELELACNGKITKISLGNDQ